MSMCLSFSPSFGSTEMSEIHCCHYTRQVGVVSYLVRVIQRLIRLCLAGHQKTGRDPLARLLWVSISALLDGDIQALTVETRSPTLFPWQRLVYDS